MSKTSELERIVTDIRRTTNQVSINKMDEVRVMKSMLNDPDFSIGVYDKTKGYLGQKCPHENAVKFVSNIIANSTGLDKKDSKHLAENYEFTNREANFMLENMRDFLYIYTRTGRKINLIQAEDTEASVYIRDMEPGTRVVPDSSNPGKTKIIETQSFAKLISSSKCPKYKN